MLRTSIDVDGVIISTNDYLFEKTKFLKIDKQNFDINVEKVDKVYNIDIESKSFLNRFYALCLNDSGIVQTQGIESIKKRFRFYVNIVHLVHFFYIYIKILLIYF